MTNEKLEQYRKIAEDNDPAVLGQPYVAALAILYLCNEIDRQRQQINNIVADWRKAATEGYFQIGPRDVMWYCAGELEKVLK